MASLRRVAGKAALAALVLWHGGSVCAADADVPEDEPIVFTADELTFDRERETVRATGNVEIAYGERILLANEITYFQAQDVVVAAGDVALLDVTGHVLFADRVEVTGDLRDGVLENLRAILADGARFAAVGGRRTAGNVTEMRKAVYSPCFLCPEDPTRPPLWQIKAVRIVHNEEQREIEYRDAWIELAGIPVVYTPYLSHPDPTVTRKSGFLFPSFGLSSDLGFVAALPYYWAISDNKDATFTPIYTSNEGPVLAVEYRHAMRNGWLSMTGSGTYYGPDATVDDVPNVRGHVFSEFRYDIDETWRGGIDFNRVSDDTYLRRYRFGGSERALTSRGFVEGFRVRDYMQVSAYGFQTLEAGVDQATLPIVAPFADYNFVSRPDPLGGRTTVDMNAVALTRQEGTDMRRLSARTEWALPFQDAIGGIYRASAMLWADGYNVSNVGIPGQPQDFSGFTGRVWPQAALEWRWPWLRDGETVDQVIQPVLQIVTSPIGGNTAKIPNEDSQAVEIDVNNLISTNRFPGIDRVEGGTRFNYGLDWEAFTAVGYSARAFLGQSYRLHTDDSFPVGSGFREKLSDVVADLNLQFAPWLDIGYRTRFDVENRTFRRNEVWFGGGVPALSLGGTYVFFADQEDGEFEGRQEINLTVQSQLTRFWRGRVFGLRDLAEEQTQLTFGIGFTYEDECFLLDGSWTRERFRDRDLEPDNAFLVRVGLKTLGEGGIGF
jgi:LPS-assembly protein